MAEIVIVGPGAVGGTVAAWLAQDDTHRITVCARTPFDRIDLETPYGRILAEPRVVTDAGGLDPADWVLVATKTYDAGPTAAWFPRLIGRETQVAILQNGVEHVERFARYVSREQILPVVVECAAERSGPGRIRQRKPAWLMVPDTGAGRSFAGLFGRTRIDVRTTDDFCTEAWRKLALNCAGALSAILLKPAGIVQIDAIADVMRGLVRECISVGRAEGARLEDELVEAVITGYKNGPQDSINSLQADRMAGRPMEIDARNGVIVRRARTHGLPAPLNQMVVALLEASGSPAETAR